MTLEHRRARRRGMVLGAAISSSRAKKQAASAPDVAAPTAVPTGDTVTQLTQLAELKDKGILTEEEFSAKKKKILGL